MSELGKMFVRIVGDNSGLDKSIDSSQKKFKAFGDKALQVGKKLSTYVTLPILAIGAAALKSAADMETQQAAFETLLGSADRAKILLEDLTEFSAKTPFQLTQLSDATKTMLSFGIEVDKATEYLKNIGDIALGDGEKLKSITLAFSQIQSTGRLMGQDLLQLINAGFNPLQEISKKTGETMAELKDRMSKGAISAQEVADAFRDATSEGGQFYGGMEKASQTLSGQISTLKDNIGILMRELVSGLLPVIKDMVAKITEVVKKFAAMDDSQKKLILTLAGLAAAAGPVITAIGGITKALAFLAANPAVAVLAGLTAVIGGLIALDAKIKESRVQEYTEQLRELADVLDLDAEGLENLASKAEEFNKVFKFAFLQSGGDVEKAVAGMARELDISVDEAYALLTTNKDISAEYREELNLIIEQRAATRELNEKNAAANEQYKKDLAEIESLQELINKQAADREATEQQVANELAEQLRLLREQVKAAKIDAYNEYLIKRADAENKYKLGIIDQIEYVGQLVAAQTAYVNFLAEGENRLTDASVYNGHIERLKELEAWYEQLTETQTEVENTGRTLFDVQKDRWATEEQEIVNITKLLQEKNNELDRTIETYKTMGETVSGYVNPILMEMGSQLVQEQFNWQNVGIMAVESIAQIVKALAEQAAVQAAVELAKGNFVGAGLWGAASVAGFVGAGAISGYAGQLKEQQTALAQQVTTPTESISETTAAATTVPKTTTDAAGEDMIHVTWVVDTEPIFDKVFPATKNGQIFIDSRAVI